MFRPSTVRLLCLTGVVLAGLASQPVPAAQGRGSLPPRPGQPPFPGRSSDMQAGDEATGVISGRVTDAGTGAPIAGATVRYNDTGPRPVLTPDAAAAAANRVLAITNASGQFVLRDVPPGQYTIVAEAAGYLRGAHGGESDRGPSRVVVLDRDGRIVDADVQLWQAAAISGVVVDDIGEPAVEAEVRALRRGFSHGRARFTAAGSARTDDRGAFRIAGLAPGDYVVVVPARTTTLPASLVDRYNGALQSGRQDAVRQTVMELSSIGGLGAAGIRVGEQVITSSGGVTGPPPGPDGHFMAFRPAWFPGEATSATAPAITLESGTDYAGVHLQLQLVPSVRVSGRAIGPDGPIANAPVRLVPTAADGLSGNLGLEVASGATTPDGSFTLAAVPAGSYVLSLFVFPQPIMPRTTPGTMINVGNGGIAFFGGPGSAPTPSPDPTLWAELPIVVRDADITHVELAVRHGARVAGRVVFDGASPPPASDELARLAVSLQPEDASFTPRSAGPISADLHFATGQYPPGRYSITVPTVARWSLESITAGGRDLTMALLDLGAGDLSDVVVTFTDRPASAGGTVRLGAGEAPGGATVLLFPANVQAWIDGGMVTMRQFSTRASESGTFTFQHVLPGNYLAAAIAGDANVDLGNPTVFQTLARTAVPVTVAPGAQASVSPEMAHLR